MEIRGQFLSDKCEKCKNIDPIVNKQEWYSGEELAYTEIYVSCRNEQQCKTLREAAIDEFQEFCYQQNFSHRMSEELLAMINITIDRFKQQKGEEK